MKAISEVAAEKGVTRGSIHNAIKRGELSAKRSGGIGLVFDNAALRSWTPNKDRQRAGRARGAVKPGAPLPS